MTLGYEVCDEIICNCYQILKDATKYSENIRVSEGIAELLGILEKFGDTCSCEPDERGEYMMLLISKYQSMEALLAECGDNEYVQYYQIRTLYTDFIKHNRFLKNTISGSLNRQELEKFSKALADMTEQLESTTRFYMPWAVVKSVNIQKTIMQALCLNY